MCATLSYLSASQCPSLRKLFLSNNKVVLVDPLIDLPALETLCLYRNTVLDLQRCIGVLQQVCEGLQTSFSQTATP